MSHSLIPPSSAHIWGHAGGCTGWVVMAQQYPQTTPSESAEAGTASHWVGGEMISAMARAGVGYPQRDDTIRTLAPNGIVITDEIYDGAEQYADEVGAVMRTTSIFGGLGYGIERPVSAPSVHELSHGTPDAFILDRQSAHLYIWDYKFGHVAVEVFENLQMINYVAGILDEFGVNGLEDQNLRVTFGVVQPRAYHRDGPIRRWSCMASALRGHINILHDMAHEALGDSASLRTGHHCKYCQARHACPAALEAGVGLYEVCQRPVGQDLSVEALSLQYSIVSRGREALELLETGYASQIEALLRSGERVPGYIMEEGRGRETWNRPIPEVIALGDLLGVDLRKHAAKTPNQARKAGANAECIAAYSHRPKTGLHLVPDNTTRARRIFG